MPPWPPLPLRAACIKPGSPGGQFVTKSGRDRFSSLVPLDSFLRLSSEKSRSYSGNAHPIKPESLRFSPEGFFATSYDFNNFPLFFLTDTGYYNIKRFNLSFSFFPLLFSCCRIRGHRAADFAFFFTIGGICDMMGYYEASFDLSGCCTAPTVAQPKASPGGKLSKSALRNRF